MKYVSLFLVVVLSVVVWSGCAVSEQVDVIEDDGVNDVVADTQQAPVVVEIETGAAGDERASDAVIVDDSEPINTTAVSTTDQLKAEQQKVYADVAELGVSKVCETTADCRSMPMGAAACGGPSSYTIYSVRDGDDFEPSLKLLSAHSERVEKKQHQTSERMGTCQYNAPPVLACVEKQCVASTSKYLSE